MFFYSPSLVSRLYDMICVFIFAGYAIKDNNHLYWVAALVGLGWVGLVWSPCCCGNTLRNVYCNRETY